MVKLLEICNITPEPKGLLADDENLQYDWFVWQADTRFRDGKRIQLLVKADRMDLVYTVQGYDSEIFLRHEIHLNNSCVYVWKRSEGSKNYLNFATEAQLLFARTIVAMAYKKCPPISIEVEMLRRRFPRRTFDFSSISFNNNPIFSGCSDKNWSADGSKNYPVMFNKPERPVKFQFSRDGIKEVEDDENT